MMFIGYIETKNKKSIEKIKDRTDFKTYEQVEKLPEFAGVLAPDTILIDIDNLEASDILFNIVADKNIKCRVYETSRGKHFYFKNNSWKTNKTNTSLAIGIKADIKLGSRNSYGVLKYGGKFRRILRDTNELQEIPKWLLPVNNKVDFTNMEVGDGRNQELFNYILTLQSHDFETEEARETIRMINKYVLVDPLSEDELETILRDEAFVKPIFFKDGTFLFDIFAVFLKNNAHIKRINNQLHLYKDGIYRANIADIEAEMITHIPRLNKTKRSEVMAYLNILVRDNTIPTAANVIAFRNGLYNLQTEELVEFTHEHVITNKINWDYNPNAYSDLADKTLNKIACGDEEIRYLLEECIGYCFYRRNELGKAFILTGEKNNGKSTFLDMIKNLLGEINISALDLGELGDRFKTAELFGKLANIGDDIDDEFISATGTFKKLVTGDRLNAERKGQDPFEFNSYAKLLFSANNIPRIGKGKDSAAIIKRLTIIPFNAKFSPTDPDFNPYIKYELREQNVMEYLILLGLQGLKRVLENRKFSYSHKAEQELQEFKLTNNPILGFFNNLTEVDYLNELTKNVYKKYQEYCISENLQPISHNEFSKQMKKHFSLVIISKRVQGAVFKVFSNEF